MAQIVVFKNTDGSIGVIHPSQEVLSKYTLKQVAEKDVPSGLSYKLMDTADLPDTRTFREAWELPEDTKFDGVGSDSYDFKE